MPTGKVRFYDAEKGFGFLSQDDGGDVYVRASALPAGVTALKAGQKVEFGVVEGRKGQQALSVRLLDAPPSLAKRGARIPTTMAIIVEDLIKMLDGIGNSYRRGKHPDAKVGAEGGQRAPRGGRRARHLIATNSISDHGRPDRITGETAD